MKKIISMLMAVSLIAFMASCEKDDNGNTDNPPNNGEIQDPQDPDNPDDPDNPQDPVENTAKIHTITTTYSDGDQETVTFTWSGNQLTRLVTTSSDGDNESIDYTYSNGQLVKATLSDTSYYDVAYAGDKVSTISEYVKGEIKSKVDFTYTNQRITAITYTSYDEDEDEDDDDYKALNKRSSTYKFMCSVLPRAAVNSIMALRKSLKGAKEVTSYTYNLTWSGNNITSIGSTMYGYTYTINYTYDNMNNPYYGLTAVLVEDGFTQYASANNALTTNISMPTLGFNETVTCTYEYNSNKYPVKVTETDEDGTTVSVIEYL
ncbi:MAG: hypothetical protein IJU81_04480 [Bacteroidales bacterium]|nr:hypothetical protein [Bacteroidales bacterium]